MTKLLIPLAATCAVCAAAYPSRAEAATALVTNCNDSGPGSLRDRIASATSGDTIDLTHLACNRILLTTGQIPVLQRYLTIIGRGRDALTIDGNLHDRVFWYWPPPVGGRLRLERLSIAHGYRTQPDHPREEGATGGCIRAERDLEFYQTRIHHCTVVGIGGAVSVEGNASVHHSLFVANVAKENAWTGFGGVAAGLAVRGRLTLDHSRVSANQSVSGTTMSSSTLDMIYSLVDHNVSGDATVTTGPAKILKSTIADNDSDGAGAGGLVIRNYANSAETLIAESTISGNRAKSWSGLSIYGDATVVNSTIAFNQESANNQPCGGALVFHSILRLEGTIVASNTCAGAHRLDLAGYEGVTTPELIGSHNLIGISNLPVPADTLSVAPRLAPLANNGGPTPTHALLCDSPAIDRGNNVLHLAYDQRGRGYPRVKGARADIGAVEH